MLDNVFVPLWLTAIILSESIRLLWIKNVEQAKKTVAFYFFGVAIVITVWLVYYVVVGWDEVALWYRATFLGNIPTERQVWPTTFFPFTPRLIMFNISQIRDTVPGFFNITALCLLPFFSILVFLPSFV